MPARRVQLRNAKRTICCNATLFLGLGDGGGNGRGRGYALTGRRLVPRAPLQATHVGLSRARLLLLANIQKTIRKGLAILGVEAPMKMAARAEAEAGSIDGARG